MWKISSPLIDLFTKLPVLIHRNKMGSPKGKSFLKSIEPSCLKHMSHLTSGPKLSLLPHISQIDYPQKPLNSKPLLKPSRTTLSFPLYTPYLLASLVVWYMSICLNSPEINLNPRLLSVSLWVMVFTRKGIVALTLLRIKSIPQWIVIFLRTPIFTPSPVFRGDYM